MANQVIVPNTINGMRPIVRARAPLRLGLAGGGSDLSPFCDQFGGFILNGTIALFVYAMIQQRSDGKVQFTAADRKEEVICDATTDIPIDGPLPLHKAVYRRIVCEYNHGRPLALNITTYSDVPAGSGLGSSSTLVVAMIQAYQELLGLPLGEYDIARLAHSIERTDALMPGGKQDQYAATFGGFNFMEFYDGDRVIVNPLRVRASIANELESSLVLFNTGVSRDSEAIIAEQTAGIENKASRSVAAMQALKQEAVEMKECLLTGDIRRLGEVLRTGWESKKKTADLVTNPHLEKVYELAIRAGAYAGKVSGAGGGGFMMFIVDPSRRPDVWKALQNEPGSVIRAQFTDQGAIAWRPR